MELKVNLCRYLKSFCYQTNVTNSSNPEKFDTKEKISKTMNPVFDSPNTAQSKSFFEKTNIQIKWSLRPLRNLISNSNLYQRLYLLGWFVCLIDILLALIIYLPLTLGISIFLASILIVIKYQSFLVECLKEISNWISITKFLRIVFTFFIIIVGEYLVLKYYPIPSWINISLEYINSFGWLNSVSLVGIAIFSIGFGIDIYSVWAKGSKLINITIAILGAIVSFLEFGLYPLP